MNGALGWALRELRVRWRGALAAALLVGALSGAAVTLELLGRAREEGVASRLDGVGAPLTIVPAGTTAGAIARGAIPAAPLGPGVERAVRSALGLDLRRMERRLVGTAPSATGSIAVVGTDAVPAPRPGELVAVAPGAELARRLAGASEIVVRGEALALAEPLPSTGSSEDLALITSLELARGLTGIPGYNALRVYLAPGVSSEDAERRLGAVPAVAVVRTDRGAVADHEAVTLARHRELLQLAMAVVVLVGLGVAAHLDTAERRAEVATLRALGAPRRAILAGLLCRSVLVSLLGSSSGLVVGVVVALDHGASSALVARSTGLAVAMLASAALVGAAAGFPSALVAAERDPVADLQTVA